MKYLEHPFASLKINMNKGFYVLMDNFLFCYKEIDLIVRDKGKSPFFSSFLIAPLKIAWTGRANMYTSSATAEEEESSEMESEFSKEHDDLTIIGESSLIIW